MGASIKLIYDFVVENDNRVINKIFSNLIFHIDIKSGEALF